MGGLILQLIGPIRRNGHRGFLRGGEEGLENFGDLIGVRRSWPGIHPRRGFSGKISPTMGVNAKKTTKRTEGGKENPSKKKLILQKIGNGKNMGEKISGVKKGKRKKKKGNLKRRSAKRIQ